MSSKLFAFFYFKLKITLTKKKILNLLFDGANEFFSSEFQKESQDNGISHHISWRPCNLEEWLLL